MLLHLQICLPGWEPLPKFTTSWSLGSKSLFMPVIVRFLLPHLWLPLQSISICQRRLPHFHHHARKPALSLRLSLINLPGGQVVSDFCQGPSGLCVPKDPVTTLLHLLLQMALLQQLMFHRHTHLHLPTTQQSNPARISLLRMRAEARLCQLR